MTMTDTRPIPVGISVEWAENGDFLFSCRYRKTAGEHAGAENRIAQENRHFSAMTRAMGNVLQKLRKEHISFPFFLVSLAFNHRNLLNEIELLLTALHDHLDQQECNGEFTCLISSEPAPMVPRP